MGVRKPMEPVEGMGKRNRSTFLTNQIILILSKSDDAVVCRCTYVVLLYHNLVFVEGCEYDCCGRKFGGLAIVEPDLNTNQAALTLP